MRRAARIDANQPEIVAALRAVGAEVTDLSSVGQGVPDLLVSFRGGWFLLEVKDGAKPKSHRTLTLEQLRWHRKQHGPVAVVCSVAQALEAIGAVVDTGWRAALGDEVRA